MPQLPLFGEVPQIQPTATALRALSKQRQAIARSTRQPQPRSPRPKIVRQPPLLPTPAATAQSLAAPPTAKIVAPIDHPLPPASTPAKELPQGWVDPSDPAFNYLKNCRLCGALIKIGGLDHSLCSADCGWVVDLQWLAWMEAHRRKRKEPEPQAATHTERGDSEALDLFSYGLDRNTSETDGGVA